MTFINYKKNFILWKFVKLLNEQREQKRKIYDHYEKKLTTLTEEKERKIKKGDFDENSRFAKKICRVNKFLV